MGKRRRKTVFISYFWKVVYYFKMRFFFLSFLILNTISVKVCCVCADIWVICTHEEAKLTENNNARVVLCLFLVLSKTKIVQMTSCVVIKVRRRRRKLECEREGKECRNNNRLYTRRQMKSRWRREIITRTECTMWKLCKRCFFVFFCFVFI